MPLYSPRAWLSADGGRMDLVSLSVHLTRTKSGDTFQAVAYLHDKGIEYWSSQDKIENVDVMISTTSDGSGVKRMSGNVDSIKIHLAENTVHLSGRDASAKLNDNKTTEQVHNKNVSEAVKDFCQRRGLTAQIGSEADKVGRTYKVDFNDLTYEESEYDAVTRYLDSAGLLGYMTDATTFKVVKLNDDNAEAYTINYTKDTIITADAVDIELSRNLVVAKGVKTKVQSWNSKQAKAITSEKGDDGGATYVYNHPDLTQEQADKIRDTNHDRATSHEMNIHIVQQGDTDLTQHKKIKLTGDVGAFAQSYFITTLEETVDIGGYKQTIDAKNKDEKKSK